ncbi:MAG TPA: sulfotransferase family protein [Gammaproteobacteria bacterium]|nr:sulfotransferase family protein [Gammaproteobacteria bacterium]
MSEDRKLTGKRLLEQAKALHSRKHHAEAIKAYRSALAADPSQAETHYLLGNALREAGRPNDALNAYRALLALQPGHLMGANNLGALLLHLGNAPAALELLLRTVKMFPDAAQIRVNLANTYNALGLLDKAIEQARMALDIKSDFFDAYCILGSALQRLGQLDEALENYSIAAALRPGDINVQLGRAHLLELKGNYPQCWTLIKPLLRTGHPRAAAIYFDLGPHIGRRDEAVILLQSLLAHGSLPDAAQSSMHFKLGKHFDETGKFDDAFFHYSHANRLTGKTFNLDNTVRLFNAIISVYNNDFVQTMPRSENNSRRPIFILGMPRSGTSLVEQILASHPDVGGGGELPYIDEVANRISAQRGKSGLFPAGVTETGRNQLEILANRYLQRVTRHEGNTKHMTDKMPHNFVYIGIIMQMFPRASIIHCARNPVDTCLSCYFSHFGNDSHDYSYNLSTLGKYYCQYRRLMDHWNDLFGHRILTITYENMVYNQESVTRDLLNFCGLEWNDRCLEFHESARTVYTLSYKQVREPLYSDSIDRWKNYGKYLTPLRKELEKLI